MKRRIIYIFLSIMFLIFLFSTTVSAKSISADDVGSRTYIIGEHMYTRDVNGDYKGSLTTQYIMYGASTIESNDIEDFIIYYKNPLGEWKNALTNETVTAPETFDIKYTNGEQSIDLQYGDVNCDGTINGKDVTAIRRYLAGDEMPTEVEIANGDVNGDGKVTEADVVLLRKYIVGNYPNAKLPNEPLGKTYIIEYRVSGETYEIDYELEGALLYENQRPEDPEKEEYIFDSWCIDANHATQFEFDKTTITQDITLYAKFVKPQYGDVNCDGTINSKDVVYLMRYLAGYEMPEDAKITNGDVNGDGRVTEADAAVFRKYIAGYYPEANLPSEPLGKTYIIEYLMDNNATYKIDYELEGQTLVEPDAPEKEGYIFDGWYTDVDYATKFEFGSTEITENITLYAKFVKPQYGDANCDGQITVRDASYVNRYLKGYTMAEDFNVENADVNGDGRVNEADFRLLMKYAAYYYPDAKLPDEPLGNTYIIEYMVDEEIYEVDYELEGHTISASQKPTDPEKEGNIFDGWYTDVECTSKFEFDSTQITENTKLYAKFVKLQYGDVNCDGKITLLDVVIIRRYAAGYVDEQAVEMKNGDINGDGLITEADAVLLAKYKQNYYPDADLSEGPLGNSYIIEYIVDEEIYEIDYELEGQPLINDPTEPEKEGHIFEGWYTDVECTTKFEFGSTLIIRNIKLYAKFTKLQYGDVDCNGKIDIGDVTYISRYVDGYEMPEEVYITNGDVNEDGKVTEADVVLLQKYLAGYYPDANLPAEPLGKSYIVEYLIDNTSDFQTYAIDYELEGHTISDSQKPKNPEKEGYTFDGWYTLLDNKKFEFGTTVVTRNIELYAKFVETQVGE